MSEKWGCPLLVFHHHKSLALQAVDHDRVWFPVVLWWIVCLAILYAFVTVIRFKYILGLGWLPFGWTVRYQFGGRSGCLGFYIQLEPFHLIMTTTGAVLVRAYQYQSWHVSMREWLSSRCEWVGVKDQMVCLLLVFHNLLLWSSGPGFDSWWRHWWIVCLVLFRASMPSWQSLWC